ncbi:response regulator [Alcaligenes nematophilus]|jgi:two-component system capsular synthesis response regulator RcsB|uniref:Response regulator n=3 Tax=Alcaligenes TaxID=507 RepID=A0AAE9HBJ3_ALCFA|nr:MULTISPECIES: response regulator [Alcaligenes]MDH4867814.1 response regulator [Bacillus cereus]KGP01013.1 LuxR family transcriptional regulator [Alcaligenes faecalis]KVX06477.1 LuxR family transcriptional regulator [Alcaligenes faecalis]MCM2559607.1 response regulator [Alcaligenes faecalis]MCM2622367.1 response regulator [Alcaligenes faecalis]
MPAIQKLRVIIADDHPLILMGIRELLGRDINLSVEAVAASPSELVEHLQKNQPDTIITDYSMPGDEQYGDGMRFISYLRRHFPDVKLIVLTMVSNPMIISSLYDAGVQGVVLKQDELSEVLVALHLLRQGVKYYPANFKQDTPKDVLTSSVQERLESLSPREFEVLRLFAMGDSISAIAEQLNRSIKTISAQKASAMRKLNVHNNQDLIAFCTQNNLFS